MKRIILIMAIILPIIFPVQVFAHVELNNSTPSDGEVITKSLTEITLEFSGTVEQGSTIEVIDDHGKDIEVLDLKIDGNTISGRFFEPLPDGDYVANYSIIGADGHVIEGSISFKVELPFVEEEQEETGIDEDKQGTEEKQVDSEKDITTTEEEGTVAEKIEKDSTLPTILTTVIIGAIILGALFFFARKRK